MHHLVRLCFSNNKNTTLNKTQKNIFKIKKNIKKRFLNFYKNI